MEVKIDTAALKDVSETLKLTERQYERSLQKATKRTVGSIRKQVSVDKMKISDLRRTTAIRRRIKPLVRGRGIWIGLNDLWLSEFKGKPRRVPGGMNFRSEFFKDAFIVRFAKDPTKQWRMVRLQKKDGKMEMVGISIRKQAMEYLEKHVLPEIPDSVFNHFRTSAEFLQKRKK